MQPVPTQTHPLIRFGPLLIVLAIAGAYQNACRGPFIFDDLTAVLGNESIRSLWPIWKPMLPEPHLATAGRPLFGVSLAINYAIGELNPFGYHLANIVIHVGVALILLAVIRRTLKRLDHPHAEGLALATTLLWAVHPLLTDTVSYVTNRAESLMAFFFLLAFYALLRSIESTKPRRWLIGSVIAALGSVACKEVGAMTLPALLLFDVLVLTRSWRKTFAARWTYYASLLLTWILLGILLSKTSVFIRAGGGSRIAPWNYLLMQSQILVQYLKLCFWPSPLVLDYLDWPVPTFEQALPTMLIMATLLGATVYLIVKKRAAGMIGAWYFLILAPSSSFLPLGSEPGAERRMYLPLAAIVLAAVLIVVRAVRKYAWRTNAGMATTVVLSLVLIVATQWRNEDYASDLSIWSHDVAHRPNNPRAQNNLGLALQARGELDTALGCYDKAVNLAPGLFEARINRGLALVSVGRAKESLPDFDRAIKLRPNDPLPWTCMGAALKEMKEYPAAKAALQKALQLNPRNETAQQMLQDLEK